MKMAIINDIHFGVRNGSSVFLDSQEKFFREVFFPTILSEEIKTVLILGDVVDKRKEIAFVVNHRMRKMFFEPAKKMGLRMLGIVGNHDIALKSSNAINACHEVLGEYMSVLINPREIEIGGLSILMVPWITPENYEQSMAAIKNSKARVCMGHFEINGFEMYQGQLMEHGLDASKFVHFERVFSGHFHHKSSRGNIEYLGAPFEMVWSDHGGVRGFHVFDTKTLNLRHVINPNRMFHRIVYDDKDRSADEIDIDVNRYENRYVKVFVENKTNPNWFDVFINKLESVAHEVRVTERSESVSDIDIDMVAIDSTGDLLREYVNNLGKSKEEASKLEAFLMSLYNEALAAQS